jgi:DNA repair protein RecO (recombination protein O)
MIWYLNTYAPEVNNNFAFLILNLIAKYECMINAISTDYKSVLKFNINPSFST